MGAPGRENLYIRYIANKIRPFLANLGLRVNTGGVVTVIACATIPCPRSA